MGDFNNGSNAEITDAYDANSNLISDLNKGIASISYNHKNLPEKIVITGKGTISFLYDAQGVKLKKTVVDNTGTVSKTTTYDYLGGFLYKQDTFSSNYESCHHCHKTL